jgi:hypothetical protein
MNRIITRVRATPTNNEATPTPTPIITFTINQRNQSITNKPKRVHKKIHERNTTQHKYNSLNIPTLPPNNESFVESV